jgi:hypothetical protein|tara:strand:- start:51 stop:290 length:240 start_codon:yes stop_codon:yes gene_type:complete
MRLVTSGFYYNIAELRKLEQVGFSIIIENSSSSEGYVSPEVKPTIVINKLEDLKKLVDMFGKIIVTDIEIELCCEYVKE